MTISSAADRVYVGGAGDPAVDGTGQGVAADVEELVMLMMTI